jgi:hypothetical protein
MSTPKGAGFAIPKLTDHHHQSTMGGIEDGRRRRESPVAAFLACLGFPAARSKGDEGRRRRGRGAAAAGGK